MVGVVLMVMSTMFFNDNKEFFDRARIERAQGASWHYVGPRPLNPDAKSLSLEGGACPPARGEKFILFKLKK
mgnify:FL=1|tara:strand:- start:232 stop:447 length:216 start_codon:yes stop_codon:yes gene_type:complete